MVLFDWLLNMAALLLWLSATRFGASPVQRRPLTLAGNLKPASRAESRTWPVVAALLGLLVVRAVVYWNLGRSLNWVATWSPGSVTVAFRSDFLGRMFLYSFWSFAWTLFHWYAALVFLAGIHGEPREGEPVARMIRDHLRAAGQMPRALLLLWPGVGLMLLWPLLHALFSLAGVLPPIPLGRRLLSQSLAVGLGGWMTLRWPLTVVLVFGMFLNIVYVGSHPLWTYLESLLSRMLRPLRWLPLRIARIDFLPMIALIALWWVVWWWTLGIPALPALGIRSAPPLLQRLHQLP